MKFKIQITNYFFWIVQYKIGNFETCLYVFRTYNNIKNVFECKKEIIFNDMRNLHMHYLFDFFVVRSFKKPKTFYIKKLKDVK